MQSLSYGRCCTIQTAAGKTNKNDRDIYLVKAPKNSNRKKKAFVKTNAINLKKQHTSKLVEYQK